MNTQTKIVFISAFAAIVVAFLIPRLLFYAGKENAANDIHRARPKAPNNMRPPLNKPVTQRTSKRGWATVLAPVYSIAVVFYVIYIMYRMSRRKKPDDIRNKSIYPPTNQTKVFGRMGRQKTKITRHELNQLEEKLAESEEVMNKILNQANEVILKVYNEQMEKSGSDSTQSSSSDSQSESTQVKLRREGSLPKNIKSKRKNSRNRKKIFTTLPVLNHDAPADKTFCETDHSDSSSDYEDSPTECSSTNNSSSSESDLSDVSENSKIVAPVTSLSEKNVGILRNDDVTEQFNMNTAIVDSAKNVETIGEYAKEQNNVTKEDQSVEEIENVLESINAET